MTVAIPLFRHGKPTNFVALVDDADTRRASRVRWSIFVPRGSRTKYARGTFKGQHVYLHRFVMRDELALSEKATEVGHVDGDGLNNTRANLRLISHAEILQAAWDREPWVMPVVADPKHIHTVKVRTSTGVVRTYRYDRRTRKRLPDDENDRATSL